jgi:thioredoxin reductase/Pyruvate/2-oxoacid:ferredoxin oxidoreductase delta subunit
MEMLLTSLAFLGLTALFIARHMRRGAAVGPAARQVAAPLKGAPCPRCSAVVPQGSAYCPACGVPQQLFEVATARAVAADEGGDAGATVAAHAVVRGDLCVGCGTCVAACPEPGAVTMQEKLAVIDIALCKGHGECVSACPIGAIALSTGASVTRVTVPQLDVNFETNVPGLYIVGELGGRGLIKNAINEGKIAVEHIGRALPAGAPRADGEADAVDVAIVGSGPAGLSAGLEALKLGLTYVVLEQGSLSDTVRKYPRRKILLAEPVRVPLYGDLWVADASKETLLQVWETIVANTGLEVRTQQKVEHIVRDGPIFAVETPDAKYRARRVVLAMGRRGTPRRLGAPGEELDKVFYDIVEMEAFQGRRVAVVGGGDSAVESAVGLANQRGTEVALVYRGDAFNRVKERNRVKLEAAVAEGRIRPWVHTNVREIRSDVLLLDTKGETSILPNDDVVIRIGGDAPYAFLERLGVRIVQKDVPIAAETAKAG